MSKKHLIAFGHSPGGSPDPGTTSGSLKEAVEIRKLKPHLEKWAKKSKDKFYFYNGNMYADRSIRNQTSYDTVTELHMDGPKGSGGHVIIFRAFQPDSIDLRLRDLIKKHFGIVGYLQKDNGISRRSNLYNVNQAARYGINYRLLELFFMSNKAHHEYYIKNLDVIAKEIIEGITGEVLDGKAGDTKPKPTPEPKKTPLQIAKEIINTNVWGNGNTRKQRLKAAGYDYNEVQRLVNGLIANRNSAVDAMKTPKWGTPEQVAQQISKGQGDWGNNPKRAKLLKDRGYDAKAVQKRVNDILKGKTKQNTKKSPGVKVGDRVRTKSLYANSMSTKNVRKTPIEGYVHTIDTTGKWRNPIRLTHGRNGGWLGYTRHSDIL